MPLHAYRPIDALRWLNDQYREFLKTRNHQPKDKLNAFKSMIDRFRPISAPVEPKSIIMDASKCQG